MSSNKIFDDVILYLERTIFDGGEIDYNEISKIAGSPAALFQRIFIFFTGIGISEYVRKRKLTLAGYDLKNSDISILDAAVKYGFGSHSAFTRAFKEHHGFTPTEAKTAELNNYPSLNFSDMRFIGGKRIMAEMKKITYKEAPERLMIGFHCETSFYDAGGVWQEYFSSGTIDKLKAIPQEMFCCDDIDPCDSIGLMYNFKGSDNFNFIIGDFVKPNADIPEGLFSKHIPKGLAVYVQIEGNNIPDIIASAYLLITEAIEKTDRKIDFDNFYWCEIYTLERFCESQKRGDKIIIDYIMPVI